MGETASARVQALRAVSLFADLSDAALQRVLEVANEFEAAAGQVLVQPKLEGSGFFILEEGAVVVEAPHGKAELGPGEFFGELALLTAGATRSARVRCVSPVCALAISRQDFAKMLHDEPSIAIHMLEVLAKRLAEAMQRP